MEQRPCTSGQSKGFCKMIFSSRFRIGMAALLSACLILTLCFFRGEMFFMRKSRVVECSADKFISLKVYTNYFNIGFPGQGSDVPCYVVLCRNGWRVGGGWIDMLQLVDDVQWRDRSVCISLFYEMDYNGRKIRWGDNQKE